MLKSLLHGSLLACVAVVFSVGLFWVPAAQTHAAGFDFVTEIVTCGEDVTSYPKGNMVCTKNQCTPCDLVKSAKRFIDFIIVIGMVVAVLLFVNAGALYVTSGGSPGTISKAHRIFMSTVIGFVITLSSWLLIDTIMKTLYSGTWGPWNELVCPGGSSSGEVCVKQRDALSADPLEIWAPKLLSTSKHAVIDARTTLVSQYNVSSSACRGECKLVSYFDDELGKFTTVLSGTGVLPEHWYVSEINKLESCPRSGGKCNSSGGGCHCNTCHAAGTCVDMSFKNKSYYNDPSKIMAVFRSAHSSGVRAVYEVTSEAEATEMRKAIRARTTTETYIDVDAQVKYIPHATGKHFSIYGSKGDTPPVPVSGAAK